MPARVKTTGTSLYLAGDGEPFKLADKPDEILEKLESSDPDVFVALTSNYINPDNDEDRITRTFFIKPRYVAALGPYLESEPVNDGDE